LKLLYWSFEPPFISKVNVCEPIIALTIIYIGTISYISSGSFNICGVNYQNRTAA